MRGGMVFKRELASFMALRFFGEPAMVLPQMRHQSIVRISAL